MMQRNGFISFTQKTDWSKEVNSTYISNFLKGNIAAVSEHEHTQAGCQMRCHFKP